MKDLKYLAAYTLPLATILALTWQGNWSYATLIYAFGVLPILELILPEPAANLSVDEREEKLSSRLFDWMLYLNLPLIYGIVWYFCTLVYAGGLSTFELVGLTLSVGIILSSNGINVAHELGHRDTKQEQLLSKIMLLPELYMHFFIEHNKGHHKNIATDLDPASARYNEILQVFWFRSTFGGYFNAWHIETKRLKQEGKAFFSIHNQMIIFQLIQLAYLLGLALYFNVTVMLLAATAGVIGFLLLETINYVEHYGLRRKRLPSGRYERVNEQHSWNANHELGRIVLYELTRHSDHHFKANKKYQILDHYDSSPQLPYGYPASMIIAMFPPIWFWVMNKEVRKYQEKSLQMA